MTRLTLTIDGMSCRHCVAAVERALQAMDGVQVEGVEIGTATLSFDPLRADADGVRAAVETAGYPVRQVEGAEA